MCGCVFPVKTVAQPLTVDVDLVEVHPAKAPAGPLDLSAITVTADDALTYSDPGKYYMHLLGIAAERSYKPGWVMHSFSHRFPGLSRTFHMVERDLSQRKRLSPTRTGT